MHITVRSMVNLGLRIGFWLVLAVALLPVPLLGQGEVDSLQQEVETAPDDTNKVWTLLRLSSKLKSTELALAGQYGERGLRLARQLGHPKGTAEALYRMGRYWSQLNNYNLATEYMVEAHDRFRSLKMPEREAKSMVYLGQFYANRGNEPEATRYFDQAEAYFRSTGDLRDIVSVNHARAVALRSFDKADSALALYQTNLDLIRENGFDDNILASTYNNMANVLKDQGQWERAHQLFEQSLALKLKIDNRYKAATTASNLAESSLRTGRIQQALKYLGMADSLAEVSGNMTARVDNMQNKAHLAFEQGRYREAFSLLDTYHDQFDSLHFANESQAMADLLQVQQESEKQLRMDLLEAEHEKLLARKDRQQSFLIVSVLVGAICLVVLLALTFFFLLNRRKNALLAQQNARIQAQLVALNQSNATLEELNREQAAMVQVVVHDLKAPMSKTLGLLDLLKTPGNLTDEQLRLLDMLGTISQDGLRLVDDLSTFHEHEHEGAGGNSGPVDVAVLFAKVGDGFEGEAARKQIQLQRSIPAGPVWLAVREDYLQRVLDNLLSNALKFSPSGTTVHLSLETKGPTLEIRVRDQGPGIGADDQKRMFRRFQKLSARPTGGESSTGLGLYIVKTLVERMGGEVEFESVLGEGAEFRLVFPWVPD